MCCLRYEQEVYEEKIARLPKIGATVETENGIGEVVGVEVLKEIVKAKHHEDDETFFKKYKASDVKIIKNGNAKMEEQENEEELQELKKLEELD